MGHIQESRNIVYRDLQCRTSIGFFFILNRVSPCPKQYECRYEMQLSVDLLTRLCLEMHVEGSCMEDTCGLHTVRIRPTRDRSQKWSATKAERCDLSQAESRILLKAYQSLLQLCTCRRGEVDFNASPAVRRFADDIWRSSELDNPRLGFSRLITMQDNLQNLQPPALSKPLWRDVFDLAHAWCSNIRGYLKW